PGLGVRLGGDQALAFELAVPELEAHPAREVEDVRVDRARRRDRVDLAHRQALEALVLRLPGVAEREARVLLGHAHARVRVLHAERLEEALAHELAPGLARDLLARAPRGQ